MVSRSETGISSRKNTSIISVSVKILPHGKGLPLPCYMSELASGMDVPAAIDGDLVILPGAVCLVPTGLSVALPPGFEIQIRPRSGLAVREGVTVVNSPGTIDADYRGEIRVGLVNHGSKPVRIRRGDRIAQMVLAPVFRVAWLEVETLDETVRGDGGFGHSGRCCSLLSSIGGAGYGASMTEAVRYDPPPLRIGDITVPLPIVQGGMGVGISMAGLASAVARAGGVGAIASVMIGITEPDFHRDPQGSTRRALAKQIRAAKEAAPGGVIGVNIMVALQDYDELARIASEAGADLIISGAGLPMKLPGLIPEGSSTKLVPIVSSARAAKIICRRWEELYSRLPDAIVVEGPLAGGHLGFRPEELESPENVIERIVPKVIEAVRPFEKASGRTIPVIAAGGIYTGADIFRFIQLGAAGVQMGTRFVATHECDASDEFKQAYIKAGKDDIGIIISPVGLPGRALKSPFLEKMKEGRKRPLRCVNKCLKTCDYHSAPYCISMALINAQRGNLDAGFVFCGANAWRVDRIVSVQELMDELVEGYREAARAAAAAG